MTVAGDLAAFIEATSFEDLPALAIERAEMVIASTVASAASGSAIESSEIVRSLSRERGGRPEASIWFDAGPRLPVADVARTNATMSDAAASDDSDLRNIAHIGTIVTATSIAMAERTGGAGRDVLTSMVLGYEIAGRIGEAVTPGFGERGFHAGMITIFGGAVAAAKAMRLSRTQMAQAIAVAATSIGGLAVAANTSLAREYDAGLSAMLAVHAAMAAQKGFVAEEAILEMPRGYFETYGAYRGPATEGVLADLGREWDITTDMGIKLMPGAHPFHAAAEAAVGAARAGEINAEDVEAIEVSGPQIRAIRGPVHPVDLVGVAHSLPYFLACAVADRNYSWVHADSEKMSDPRIYALAERVRAGPPVAEGANPIRNRWGATVTIITKDGRRHTNTVDAPRGSGPRGIDWADVDSKYRTLVPAAGMPDKQIEDSLRLIHELDRVGSVSELVTLLGRR